MTAFLIIVGGILLFLGGVALGAAFFGVIVMALAALVAWAFGEPTWALGFWPQSVVVGLVLSFLANIVARK